MFSGDNFSKVSSRVPSRFDVKNASIYFYSWGSDLPPRGDSERDVHYCGWGGGNFRVRCTYFHNTKHGSFYNWIQRSSTIEHE